MANVEPDCDRAIARFTGWEDRPRILVLSSSFYTDRMLFYSNFFSTISPRAFVRMWVTSVENPRFTLPSGIEPAAIENFPEVRPFKMFPYTYLRRINEFAWDFRLHPPSRLSAMKHLRRKRWRWYVHLFNMLGYLLSALKVEAGFEDWLEKLLLRYPRSPSALERLQRSRPDVLVATGIFRPEEPAIVAVAKNLGIPVLALVNAWDNPSTKSRLVFKYDGYVVWSEEMRQHLHHFYPHSRKAPVYLVGAPQFDVFFHERFHLSRDAFCGTQGLRSDLPIIVYAVGSPNFLQEHHGALYLAERIAQGGLGNVQLIVRLHPQFDYATVAGRFKEFGPRVVVQYKKEPDSMLIHRFQSEDEIIEWVNTFRHADVVVNLSSTVAIEAAILDRPVVNLDYDPEPGQPNQALVKDVNHLWTHFKPIAESGGVWLVNDPEEMVEAVKTYLVHPELHRQQRRWIAEYVCGYLDGRCGERLAEAILDFARHHAAAYS